MRKLPPGKGKRFVSWRTSIIGRRFRFWECGGPTPLWIQSRGVNEKSKNPKRCRATALHDDSAISLDHRYLTKHYESRRFAAHSSERLGEVIGLLEWRLGRSAGADQASNDKHLGHFGGQVTEDHSAYQRLQFAVDTEQRPKAGAAEVFHLLEIDNQFLELVLIDGGVQLVAQDFGEIISLDPGRREFHDHNVVFDSTTQLTEFGGRHGLPRLRGIPHYFPCVYGESLSSETADEKDEGSKQLPVVSCYTTGGHG